MSFLADRSAVSIGLGGIPSLRSGTGGLNPSLDLNFAVSKSLDPRITFTRASEARYYDASTVAVAEQNLLTESQTFDNGIWTKVNSSVTANSTAAPDGTTTADSLIENSATSNHGCQQSTTLTAAQHTFSVYVKPNGRSWVQLVMNNVANGFAYFDVTAGSVGTVGAGATAAISNAGGGWYRCSITFTAVAGTSVPIIRIASANGTASYAGDGTSGIYVWGAQLEQRSTVTAYTPTTTAAVTNYIPVLQVAPINLLTYSEEFDNAVWSKSGVTIEPNVVQSPDNTINADKLVESTGAAATHQLSNSGITVASGTYYTFTTYIKAAGRNWAAIQFTGSGVAAAYGAYFDLSSGVVGNTLNVPFATSITAVGNGWYRCSVTTQLTVGTTVNVFVYTASANGIVSYAGDGTSGIYIWGAQLQTGSSAGAYARTTNVSTGAPRFDHNPVTRESLGLLIEEQRTNLLTYSEQFDNASWSKFQANITANAVIAPDGTLSADKLIGSSGTTAEHAVKQLSSFTSGQPYSYSFYAKAGELTTLRFWVSTNVLTGGSNAIFNLSTGTYSSTSGATYSCVAVGNGWHRLTVSFTATTTTTSSAINIDLGAVTGNGFSGIYIWGAQLEAGAFPTSYIPTVASQVTRSADAASMTGTNFSSWYRQDEGTVLAEAATFAPSSVSVRRIAAFNINANESSETNRLFTYNGKVGGSTTSAGVSVSDLQPLTYTLGATFKFAYGYKLNDFAAVGNGGAVSTDTSGNTPTSINELGIGCVGPSAQLNGTIKRLAYYPVRLANATLQSLTA